MINAGTVYGGLVLNAEQYFKTLEEADRKTKSFENKLKGYGDKMEKAGKTWTKKVSAPIVGVGTLATKLGLDFQSAMSEVGAISGATSKDLELLEKKAREMGATTKFSASDAAEGLKYMAMAGWETNDMLDAIGGVLDLAAASGEDLGLVSDIVTDSMTAFGMAANEAGHFADVLAMASSSSNTNVGLMGETFGYVAPLAGALGYSIEDTALAIGLMANAGIKGSKSGTALRSMITRLVKPTKESAEAMEKLGIEMTNADGTMKPFNEVLVTLRDRFKDLDKDQQAFYAAQLAGQEAMSGFLAIVNASDADFVKLESNINNATGAAGRMSKEMQDNLKGRWQEFKSALEEVALQIYDLLLPALENWLAKGQAFIDWFSALDDGTKKVILKIAGFAAAIGPVLLIGGKFATSIGTIAGMFAKFSGAATVATTATTGLTTPVWALGGAAKAGALLLNPWTAAIVAGGVAAYALYKNLSQDAIPAVELFGDEVSDATQKAVGGFLDLAKEATLSLNQLSWSGQRVTEEMRSSIVNTFGDMTMQIVHELETQREEALTQAQAMSEKLTSLSEEEKERLITITTERYNEQIRSTYEGQARIAEIMNQAQEENRALTEEEAKEINKIKEDMKIQGIKVLSETEAESLGILERMKQQAEEITAQQAAEVVKNSLEQKEKAVEQAEEEYDERLKFAAQLKADGTKESEELAQKIIDEAKKQRDESIKAAEDMHEKVIEEAQNQAGEHVDKIDWTTGEILSKWQVLKKESIKKAKEMGEGMKVKFEETAQNAVEWGQNIVRGINEGLDSMQSWIDEKTEKFASGIAGTFKRIFRIASPSGLMADYGRYIVEGLNQGIEQNKSKATETMEGFANLVDSSFNKVQHTVKTTVGIIEKEFKLWEIRNRALEDSSEYLAKQLEMQTRKHEQLTGEIKVAEKAMQDIIAKYGEGSIHAAEYKNRLLELKITQEELGINVEETTKKIEAQTKAMQSQVNAVKEVGYSSIGSSSSGGSSSKRDRDRGSYDNQMERVREHAEYDRENSKEIERISREHDVDSSTAREMDKINKREGKQIYHDGGWVGKPLFDLEGMLVKMQSLLKHDEIAGVLQKGEFVLNKDIVNRIQGAMESIDMVAMPKRNIEISDITSQGKYSKSGDINQKINIYSPTPLSPSETARKYKQASQQLAMEWGF